MDAHCWRSCRFSLHPAYSSRICPRLTWAGRSVKDSLSTKALEQGTDLVITGRVADPAIHEFGCSLELGKGTMMGHLLECGGQVTGGYFAEPGGMVTVSEKERLQGALSGALWRRSI